MATDSAAITARGGIFAQVGEGAGAPGSPAALGSDPYNPVMIDEASVYLEKAEESLAGAESEVTSGRYNNCANPAYYACFQAAIAALIRAGIRPSKGNAEWTHAFVQSQFNGQLVNRRKRYPASVRPVLGEALVTRERGDDKPVLVNQARAMQSLRGAKILVAAVRDDRE